MELERTIADQQKLRFKAVLETEDKERKRIAQDLHDGLGQLLSTARLNVASLEDAVENDDDESRIWKNSLNLIDEACTEVRNISHAMMPNVLIQKGIKNALQELVDKINASGQLNVDLNFKQFDDDLSEIHKVAVYRIVQEVLNNTIKHAEATKATVKLETVNSNLFLHISDNGMGFDLNQIENSSGIGWKNIQSRIETMNGTMNIQSRNGSTIEIKLNV